MAIIRSSKHTLKYCTQSKRESLSILIDEYRRVLQNLIDIAWEGELLFNGKPFIPQTSKINLSSYFPEDVLKSQDTWLSARILQAIGKQACSMLLAATKKRQKQYFMLAKLQRENEDTSSLQRAIDRQPLVKPNASNANLELDSRFIDISPANNLRSPFDLFVKIGSLGNKLSINVPIKHTKVSRKWESKGVTKKSIRLSPDNLYLFYEVEPEISEGHGSVAIDQGITTACTLSDTQVTKKCNHGHDLSSILDKLSRRKKGSKGMLEAQRHRDNYIGWSINQLNFKQYSKVKIEKLTDIGRGTRRSRKLTHWTYTKINDKITQTCECLGIEVEAVPNQFRSQRCSSCGYVHKKNRKGKQFCCQSCGFSHDADYNAALNLDTELYDIPSCFRELKLNLKGFYWNADSLTTPSGEFIVPQTLKS